MNFTLQTPKSLNIKSFYKELPLDLIKIIKLQLVYNNRIRTYFNHLLIIVF